MTKDKFVLLTFSLLIIFVILFSCKNKNREFKEENNLKQSQKPEMIFDTDDIEYYEDAIYVHNQTIRWGKSDILKSLKDVTILNSKLTYDINNVLTDSLRFLDISFCSYKDNFYADTLLEIEKMSNLEVAYFGNNNFGVYIGDSLKSIRKLNISYNENEEMDKYYSYIDANKFPKLESLFVHCRRCEVQLPKKKLKMLSIKTSKIDTFYKDTSIVRPIVLEK